MQNREPTYPGRVTMTPVFGQANTYDMERADQPLQQGTPLNKATLLKDATAALYGLGTGAVPDDVLAELGKYKQHWWRRRVPKTTGYIEDLVVANGWLSKGSGNINYAKSISISSAGEITFQSEGAIPITGTFPSTVLDTPINSLKSQLPCYIKTTAGGDFTSSTILYLSENTDITKGDYSGDSDYGIYMSNGYTVTAKYVSNEAGSWQYVYSSNRNAYPDSGTQDGYEYEYLGIPFDNAVTAPKIETGSYVGTGTYGQANPNTLTFDFEPKMVIIYERSQNRDGQTVSANSDDTAVVFTYNAVIRFNSSVNGRGAGIVVTRSDKTLQWYSTVSYMAQLNYNEQYFIAIG